MYDGARADLFENSLLELAMSCDGEPAPDRGAEAILPPELIAPGKPYDGREPAVDDSIGELPVEGDPERVWLWLLLPGWDEYP